MTENSIGFYEKEYQQQVEEFAKDTLKEVEMKSKMLGITVNQISEVLNLRK